MLSSEVTRPSRSAKLAARIAAIALGTALLAGCQAQPLYGNLSGEPRSVTVSKADSRVEQIVRNDLVLGFGGEQAAGVYTLEISATSSIAGILPGGLDNEFSAARATVIANYALKASKTGDTIKTGTRSAEAQLDLPSQNFAGERAKLNAETRAARAVAALVLADVAAALPR
ncbi:hypothetical protein [Hoeflea sp.]|uniref:hypothetical protein n=1 Tax=Hoeflea sp. TaxID=1940281 RepID=UPI003748B5E9